MNEYEESLKNIKCISFNYFENKIEIDFFLELHGFEIYKKLIELLKKKNYQYDIKTINKVYNFNLEISKLVHEYLHYEEEYLRAFLYINKYVVNLKTLNEKPLSSLLKIIASNKNIKDELNLKDIYIQDIISLNTKAITYQIVFSSRMNEKIEYLYNLLPDFYKKSFKEKLLKLYSSYSYIEV